MYSTSIAGSFITARTFADTTAILFKEPDTLPTRRQSDNLTQTQRACKKTVIPLGKVKKKFDPLLSTLSTLTKPISDKKSELLRNAGLSCLYPKLLRPFQPILDKVSCIVGLDEEEENEFVKTEKCSLDVLATPPYTCSEPSLETKPIQQGLKLRPNMEDIEQEDKVRTLDDCFPGEMTKATYGARVHVVLVNDESCEDELYADICKEQETLNRILFEDDCFSPGCVDPVEDIYRPCFGCDNAPDDIFHDKTTRHDNTYHKFWSLFENEGFSGWFKTKEDFSYAEEKQAGESDEFFQATRQSRRLVCRRTANGRTCRLRVSRLMQIRRLKYFQAQDFVQSEKYLSQEDIDIIRRYFNRLYFFTT